MKDKLRCEFLNMLKRQAPQGLQPNGGGGL